MDRRTALKIVTLGAMTPQLEALGATPHCAMPAGTAWTPGNYKLKFFTDAENELLDQLTEMIIPVDSHSPGAHAARVSWFLDLMVATSDQAAQAQWRHGLRAFQEAAAKSTVADTLARAATEEEHPTSDLGRFFTLLKAMTVDGYYTSEIGIHQDLQYIGNTYLDSFPGCPPLV